MRKLELLIPAGSLDVLKTAVLYGADAVYLGGEGDPGSVESRRENQAGHLRVLVDAASAMGRRGGVGRSYADAPEIDGVVHLLPPEKISKQFKVGDFVRARIVQAQGHDLVAQPL